MFQQRIFEGKYSTSNIEISLIAEALLVLNIFLIILYINRIECGVFLEFKAVSLIHSIHDSDIFISVVST